MKEKLSNIQEWTKQNQWWLEFVLLLVLFVWIISFTYLGFVCLYQGFEVHNIWEQCGEYSAEYAACGSLMFTYMVCLFWTLEYIDVFAKSVIKFCSHLFKQKHEEKA